MMIAAALIMEASTPFVSLRSVLSQLDGMRHSRLYIANGIAMVVAFFSCRILIYPIFYTVYGKIRGTLYTTVKGVGKLSIIKRVSISKV